MVVFVFFFLTQTLFLSGDFNLKLVATRFTVTKTLHQFAEAATVLSDLQYLYLRKICWYPW